MSRRRRPVPPWRRLWVVSVVTTAVVVGAMVLSEGLTGVHSPGVRVVQASIEATESTHSVQVVRARTRTPIDYGLRGSAAPTDMPRANGMLRKAAEEAAQRLEQARLKKLRAKRRERREAAVTVFRVASFNVLGASHTSGRRANRRGFSTGVARMAVGADLLSARGIDVVGFQEFEDPQYASFMSRTGGSFGVYPGRALGPKSIRFSIAWRLSEWTLVEASSVTVPYAGGSRIQMPYVLLRDNASGREVYFANFHNPADTPRLGRNARWRAIATSIEVGLANRLAATGHPVVITGDMNDRAGYFCRMTTQAPMHAAIGGSSGSPCVPPAGMQVDWIFGSSQIAFSGYATDRSAPIPRVSDHPLVYAQGVIDPSTS
jgi:endonuclease/exonuclease/phosphatase family metal-dependent hydrolase